MVVKDFGTPRLSAVQAVTISVSRNFFKPEFSPGRREKTIPETLAVGSFILSVNATDKDAVSLVIYLFNLF